MALKIILQSFGRKQLIAKGAKSPKKVDVKLENNAKYVKDGCPSRKGR